jgi:hypothetical protein
MPISTGTAPPTQPISPFCSGRGEAAEPDPNGPADVFVRSVRYTRGRDAVFGGAIAGAFAPARTRNANRGAAVGKFARSWAMTKESFGVLRQDKSLIVFPLVSSIALLAIMASFAAPAVLMAMQMTDAAGEPRHPTGSEKAIFAVIAFGFYFVTFTVMNFFNVALVGAALERFAGREASLKAGLAIATSRIPQILAWSLVAATVGMILKALEERFGLLGRIVISLVGMAWAIATFFVIPVLAAEGVGPFDALKRSVAVLKKTWGEAALTRIGTSVVFGIFILITMVLGVAGTIGAFAATESFVLAVSIGVVAVLCVVALSLISTTLQTIIQAALYRYAVEGTAPAGFRNETLAAVFEPKKTKA